MSDDSTLPPSVFTTQPKTSSPWHDFMTGGLTQVMRGQGMQLPDWSNRVSDFMQSPAVNTAMGMVMPTVSGAGVGIGAAAPKAAANMNPSAAQVQSINAEKDRLYELLMKSVKSNKNKGTPNAFEKRIGSQINDLTEQLPTFPRWSE